MISIARLYSCCRLRVADNRVREIVCLEVRSRSRLKRFPVECVVITIPWSCLFYYVPRSIFLVSKAIIRHSFGPFHTRSSFEHLKMLYLFFLHPMLPRGKPAWEWGEARKATGDLARFEIPVRYLTGVRGHSVWHRTTQEAWFSY